MDRAGSPGATNRPLCFEVAIGPTGVPQEIHRYEAAHGFFNETVAAYDSYSAAKSWQRTLAFLREHL